MPRKTWTLTDVEQDIYVESLSLSRNDVGGAASGYAVTKKKLQGGLRQGVDVVEVDNGRFRFVVVPTRGMGVWRANQDGVHLGWRSPVNGPVHPALVRLWEPSGIGWLDGFDELLVRCGLESNGAPEFHADGRLRYPLHGKIANTPAHKVEVAIDGDSGEISVTGVVDEARLFGNKLRLTTTYTTRAGMPGVTVTDTIESLSAEASELELLYHINFGTPLVSPGAKVVLPARKVAPRDASAVAALATWDAYGPESPGAPEVVYFVEMAAGGDGRTRALLESADGGQGVSLSYRPAELPCFSLWKNPQAAADGYVTGLEPAINFPNPKSFEKAKGRVAVLGPGERRTFELALEVHATRESVAEARAAVEKLTGGKAAEMRREPDPEWSKG